MQSQLALCDTRLTMSKLTSQPEEGNDCFKPINTYHCLKDTAYCFNSDQSTDPLDISVMYDNRGRAKTRNLYYDFHTAQLPISHFHFFRPLSTIGTDISKLILFRKMFIRYWPKHRYISGNNIQTQRYLWEFPNVMLSLWKRVGDSKI